MPGLKADCRLFLFGRIPAGEDICCCDQIQAAGGIYESVD